MSQQSCIVHVNVNDPRAVTHAGPSVHRVCPVACTKALRVQALIMIEKGGRGLETEKEAKYVVMGCQTRRKATYTLSAVFLVDASVYNIHNGVCHMYIA